MAENATKYNLERIIIGTGSFGTTVHRGFHKDNPLEPVAVKKVNKGYYGVTETSIHKMETEVMKKASGHPNILHYICTEEDVDYL